MTDLDVKNTASIEILKEDHDKFIKAQNDITAALNDVLTYLKDERSLDPKERTANQGKETGASRQRYSQGPEDTGEKAIVTPEGGKEGHSENARTGRTDVEKYSSFNHDDNHYGQRPGIAKSGYDDSPFPTGYQIIKAALNGWGREGVDAEGAYNKTLQLLDMNAFGTEPPGPLGTGGDYMFKAEDEAEVQEANYFAKNLKTEFYQDGSLKSISK